MPSSPLRRKLRADGHALKPILRIGTNGVTEGVVAQIRSALAIHELIKIAVSADAPVDRFAVAEQLAEESIQVAQVIGRMILAYAPAPKKRRRRRKMAPAIRRSRVHAAARRGFRVPRNRGPNGGRAPRGLPERGPRPERGAEPARTRTRRETHDPNERAETRTRPTTRTRSETRTRTATRARPDRARSETRTRPKTRTRRETRTRPQRTRTRGPRPERGGVEVRDARKRSTGSPRPRTGGFKSR